MCLILLFLKIKKIGSFEKTLNIWWQLIMTYKLLLWLKTLYERCRSDRHSLYLKYVTSSIQWNTNPSPTKLLRTREDKQNNTTSSTLTVICVLNPDLSLFLAHSPVLFASLTVGAKTSQHRIFTAVIFWRQSSFKGTFWHHVCFIYDLDVFFWRNSIRKMLAIWL